jgi:hypothetical protein
MNLKLLGDRGFEAVLAFVIELYATTEDEEPAAHIPGGAQLELGAKPENFLVHCVVDSAGSREKKTPRAHRHKQATLKVGSPRALSCGDRKVAW